MSLLDSINDGRTDLVFEHLKAGPVDTAKLIETCAYFGDVSAIKYLLQNGGSLDALGKDLGLIGACFHGHWQLVQFLIERGAKVNVGMRDTGETALHTALSQTDRGRHNIVVRVLLTAGANPNRVTKKNVATGAFMRDCRTKGETPLHRAAAFGDEEAVQMLLDAGAKVEAVDMNGETPLSWASWYVRPAPILRKLLYGTHRIRDTYAGMNINLIGKAHS